MNDLGQQVVGGRPLDVRENVRFEGGYLTQWVHERYEGVGCALAVELKKVFMDEWTGVPDEQHLDELTTAFADCVPLLLGQLACGAT
jgi:N-formylglutamate deformylase